MTSLGKDEGQGGALPQADRAVAADAAEPEVSALRASIPSAVIDVIAEANNSLYGSQAFFLSTESGEPDRYHLARPIEELKESSRKNWQRAELFKGLFNQLVNVTGFNPLGACLLCGGIEGCSHTATERYASAIEARRAETPSGSVHESADPKGDAQTPSGEVK